ncbi:MAG: SGNH/GDSL hydrolase family protein [Desulfobacterales bacterium]
MFRFLFFILAILLPLDGFALCAGDFDSDGDVDGWNLQELASGRKGVTAAFFAADFGRTGCPDLPVAPLNQFTIGDSIGEGEAADGTIGGLHHEVVWATGYAADIVSSLNERFAASEPGGYFENNADGDATFNQAVSGAEMADFEAQANAVAAAAAANPDVEAAGMVSVLLGNNDVCSATSIAALTDPIARDLFEQRYRAGLDVLAASPATRDAFIHVSGIPAIYWLWNAERNNFVCRVFVWPFVPCQILLSKPANDCGSGSSHLDPDTIYQDDGPNCVRRKQFHAAIRDVYNPILSDVLLEYKTDGRLPNAYFVDIFDIQFEGIHVNDGDCFHPSIVGHAMLADEEWCRSHWGATDPVCGN